MQAIVLAVPMTMQVPTEGQRRPLMSFDFGDVDVAGAVLRPEAAAIGAGAEDFAFVIADDHGAGRKDDGRKVGAGGGHHLRGESLVAAADEDDGVHGLRADHLLGVHRHEVAQEHGGGMGEALADGDGRENHGQAASEHDAALHALDQVGDIAVAGVVVAEGVGDADDGALQRVVGVAHRLDERLAEEEREAGVAVAGQSFAKPCASYRFLLRLQRLTTGMGPA